MNALKSGNKDPFMIRAQVADFDAISAEYINRSKATLARHEHRCNVAYGPHPGEKLDIILPEKMPGDVPIHMFVHGGYWRAGSKNDYAYIADPIVAAGGIAVIIDYALMPETRLGEIVKQVRRAADWTVKNATSLGAAPKRFTASGHSAGAHLASYLAAAAPGEKAQPNTINSLILVSGIYDLAPIPRSFLQAEIGLTSGEVEQWSPLDATHAVAINRTLLVGREETRPFHEQADQLGDMLAGNRTKIRTLGHLNHMSIILDMGDPATNAGRKLADCVADF